MLPCTIISGQVPLKPMDVYSSASYMQDKLGKHETW